ncbi:hypothetical protein BBOV_III003220 [Babesia bovis T2Bo]|nr:hypothetical protein BBOV_III003220 [Babesia bovis T2Bo]EDO07886.2 hypothetical protein BBOV_III003220 [Babesia bovis T2Bo]
MLNDGSVIAVGDNAVFILDSTGRVEREVSKDGFKCNPNSVASTSNIVCIATGDKAKIAFISESKSYKVSVPELITAVTFSRSGDLLYAGSNTGRLYVWQISTGTLIKNKQIFFNSITDIKVDFENVTILISAQNGDIALIRLVELFLSDSKGTVYVGHSATVIGIANLMQEPYTRRLSFVSISRDKNVRFWNHKERTAISSYFLEHVPLSVEQSKISQRLYIACDMGHIAIVPLDDFKKTFYLSGHVGAVTGCVEAFNLVTCALDGVRIWDVDSRLCISHYAGIGPRINKLLSGVILEPRVHFVPLKNIVSDDKRVTTCME